MENKFLTGIDGFVSGVIFRGCCDWVQAGDIVDAIFNLQPAFQNDVSQDILQAVAIAERKMGVEEFNLARVINNAIIRKVLTDGLMEIGDIDWPGKGLWIWPLTIEDSLRKVEDAWDNMHGQLPMGGVYWLQNTSRGYDLKAKLNLQLDQWSELNP